MAETKSLDSFILAVSVASYDVLRSFSPHCCHSATYRCLSEAAQAQPVSPSDGLNLVDAAAEVS